MESFSSSVSTVPSFEDVLSHNRWNPLLELLSLEQVSGIFASFVDEIDLAKIALSCHFALDLLCYNFELLVTGAFYLSTTSMIAHFHSSFRSVVSLDSLQVGSRTEKHTLSVRPGALTEYPTARSPSIRVLIDLDDANLICIVTIANGTCVTQHKMFDCCVVVATAIFMDRCSCHQKVRGRRSRRRFAEPLSPLL